MSSFFFNPIRRPEPPAPDSNLDEELEKAAEDAKLTLYFVNMVIVSASNLTNADFFLDKSDPYALVDIGGVTDKTPTIMDNLNPVWNEKMNFFLPKNPEKMEISVFNWDSATKDDLLGTAEFDFGDMFATKGDFDGELDLKGGVGKKQRGKIRIRLTCNTFKPVETEIKLAHTEKVLECKAAEQKATVEALDESEKLREDAINTLSQKEQEIIQKAEELAERQSLHQDELTEKEKQLLDQAQLIEDKIQEIEEAQIALQETELKKQEVETKLSEAEKEILRKAEELEEKERKNAEELTAKEKEILAAADRLEEKAREHQAIQTRLDQVEGLKKEVENELTSKEQIILDQAKQIEANAREASEQLTSKEKEIVAAGKALAEKDRAAQEAQQKQDATQAELDTMKKTVERLEAELKKSKDDLDQTRDLLAEKKDCATCNIM